MLLNVPKVQQRQQADCLAACAQMALTHLGEQIDYDPGQSLFIDDSLAVLDAARIHGVARLFGIAQPDSQGERMQHERYTLLESFAQIMPS